MANRKNRAMTEQTTYGSVLSCLAFERKWGWCWPWFDKNLSLSYVNNAVLMLIIILIDNSDLKNTFVWPLKILRETDCQIKSKWFVCRI